MKDYKQVLKDALVNITGMFLTMPRVKAIQKAEDSQSIMLTMDDGNDGIRQIEAYPVEYSYFGVDYLEDVGEILTEAYGEDFELFRIYCRLYEIVSKEKTDEQRFSIWDIRDVIETIKDDIGIRVVSKVLQSDFVETLEKVQLFVTRLNLMGVKTNTPKTKYLDDDLERIEMVFPSSVAGDVVYSHGFSSRTFDNIRSEICKSEYLGSSKEKAFSDLLHKKPIIKSLNAFFLLSYIIDYTLNVEYLAKTRSEKVSQHDLTIMHNIKTLWRNLVQNDHRLYRLWSGVKSTLANRQPDGTTIEIKTFVEL